jgi:ubiquinone biosynthesis accessory factor UbiK
MFDQQQLESVVQRLNALLPDDLGMAKDEFSRNVKAVLQTGLRKLDLVTREEFEVQRAVLLRTREKLEALEAKLSEMEAQNT